MISWCSRTLTVQDSHECADEILYALRNSTLHSLQMTTEGHSEELLNQLLIMIIIYHYHYSRS